MSDERLTLIFMYTDKKTSFAIYMRLCIWTITSFLEDYFSFEFKKGKVLKLKIGNEMIF